MNIYVGRAILGSALMLELVVTELPGYGSSGQGQAKMRHPTVPPGTSRVFLRSLSLSSLFRNRESMLHHPHPIPVNQSTAPRGDRDYLMPRHVWTKTQLGPFVVKLH